MVGDRVFRIVTVDLLAGKPRPLAEILAA